MKNLKFAIIGAGNMGSAIAQGFLKTGAIKPENITITDQRSQPLEFFKSKGVNTGSDNGKAVESADVIILAVKPYLIKTVLTGIHSNLNPGKQILISIAAGVSIGAIEEVTGKMPVFRVMPNTAIAIQESMTFVSDAYASKEQLDLVMSIFNQLGTTVSIPEDLMSAATALGSCGTGYAMRYIRASVEGGVEMGFTPSMAQTVVAQTMLGAAKLLLTTGNHPEQEIDRVTTPKGSTIAGLNEMEHNGFSSSVIRGLIASFNKIKG
jgi:pyrroline-5-carboxylate reductase